MGKIVANPTDSGQAVILTTTEEGVTGGYFDKQGEWHEFGGGGGSSLQPVVHLTLINDGGENPFDIIRLDLNYEIINNHIYHPYTHRETIPVGGSFSWDALRPVIDDDGDSVFFNPIDTIRTNYSGSNYVIPQYTLRTAENCSLEDGTIIVTDITKEASIELVVTYSINDEH